MALVVAACRRGQQSPCYSPSVHIFADLVEGAAPRVVELGGREVCPTQWAPPAHWRRVGVDIIAGPGVDVVADAHQLSRHIAPGTIDAMYSVATWEHLVMPWKVVLEVNRVLREGGVAWIVTHKDFPVHDAPWDFYRFGNDAWPALFNEETGFEVLARETYAPLRLAPEAPGQAPFAGHSGSQVQVRKIGEAQARLRWDAAVEDILPRRHRYPVHVPTFRRKVEFKLRQLADRAAHALGRREERHPPRDPWGIETRGRRERWLHVRGPSAAPLEGAAETIEMRGPGEASHRSALLALHGRTFDGVALLGVLHDDPQPWTLAPLLRPLLHRGGLVYVETAQTPHRDDSAKAFWGLSSDALFSVFHPRVGFRMVRRAMFDPCAMTGEHIGDAGESRGYLRVLGLARAVASPRDCDGFVWCSPAP